MFIAVDTEDAVFEDFFIGFDTEGSHEDKEREWFAYHRYIDEYVSIRVFDTGSYEVHDKFIDRFGRVIRDRENGAYVAMWVIFFFKGDVDDVISKFFLRYEDTFGAIDNEVSTGVIAAFT